MRKIALILALAISTLTFKAQQAKYYITDQGGQPWGSNSNVNDMNTAFGKIPERVPYRKSSLLNIKRLYSMGNIYYGNVS